MPWADSYALVLPDHPIGSRGDIERRIRRFYDYWSRFLSVTGNIVPPAQQIVIREVTHRNAQRPHFQTSGMVVRAFYETNEHGNTRSAVAPSVYARYNPYQEHRWEDLWEEAASNQARPPVWHIGDESVQLSHWLSFPRCALLQSTPRRRNIEFHSLMSLWLKRKDDFTSFYEPGDGDPYTDAWHQLPVPGVAEERPQGSPHSPYKSSLRLGLIQRGVDQRQASRMEFDVDFLIERCQNGSFRPWEAPDMASLVAVAG
ncbi:uncharacterized protein JCM15063_004416 [Sporobolomyces koalae]|uniref:uncharacterized protein n=1 Tax=Sporobolomyces koalae TaxID=500713 RepID=UPI00317D48F8